MVGLPQRIDPADDSLPAWTERYLDLAVRGVRSAEVAAKISRHLQRFAAWITDGLGHDRLSAVTPREVSAWRDHLAAASTSPAALFLAAASIGARRPGGRLSPARSTPSSARSATCATPRCPTPTASSAPCARTTPRHTFAFQLSQSSGHNRAELERRLGHANDRYLRLYTNPPDDIAARLYRGSLTRCPRAQPRTTVLAW
ncbi:hypothetical protein [Thermoactinospora rubra]|uniref:hypothetical protein n=1 Tax=Thermoactinospora rubra TaxID=1088767 RepID=UPI000A110CD4|nr:hypothetical protein [Thermoactinospora rubra]